jgi:hypothetical protein
MLGSRAQRTKAIDRRPIRAAAFAVFALLLQSLAPLQILPPSGQAVHFGHAHHGDRPGGNDRPGAPRQEAPACPVCQALQAGGNSIHAPASFAAPVRVVYAALPLPAMPEARPAPTLARPHARPPPVSV